MGAHYQMAMLTNDIQGPQDPNRQAACVEKVKDCQHGITPGTVLGKLWKHHGKTIVRAFETRCFGDYVRFQIPSMGF